MNEKGASRVDKAAHTIAEFTPLPESYGTTQKDGYIACYHESKLYSVKQETTGIKSLVYAKSPYDAIKKLKQATGTNMNTSEENSTFQLTIEEAIDQLADLIKDRQSFVHDDEGVEWNEIWLRDIEALRIAIAVMKKQLKTGGLQHEQS